MKWKICTRCVMCDVWCLSTCRSHFRPFGFVRKIQKVVFWSLKSGLAWSFENRNLNFFNDKNGHVSCVWPRPIRIIPTYRYSTVRMIRRLRWKDERTDAKWNVCAWRIFSPGRFALIFVCSPSSGASNAFGVSTYRYFHELIMKVPWWNLHPSLQSIDSLHSQREFQFVPIQIWSSNFPSLRCWGCLTWQMSILHFSLSLCVL